MNLNFRKNAGDCYHKQSLTGIPALTNKKTKLTNKQTGNMNLINKKMEKWIKEKKIQIQVGPKK